MKRAHFFSALIVAVAVMVAAPTVPATAAAYPELNAATAAYLATHPGGVPLDSNEISYSGGTFVVTVTPPLGPSFYPDCPAGWFCFYQYTYYGYPRGRLSSCGWQDLATWGWQNRVESAYYNLLNGATSFIQHSPGTSHIQDYTLFTIGVGLRGIVDVAPYRQMADYVYRYC